jgi:hypothetical protein
VVQLKLKLQQQQKQKQQKHEEQQQQRQQPTARRVSRRASAALSSLRRCSASRRVSCRSTPTCGASARWPGHHAPPAHQAPLRAASGQRRQEPAGGQAAPPRTSCSNCSLSDSSMAPLRRLTPTAASRALRPAGRGVCVSRGGRGCSGAGRGGHQGSSWGSLQAHHRAPPPPHTHTHTLPAGGRAPGQADAWPPGAGLAEWALDTPPLL